ncbi:saccharopine dehydrogenase C-terminal domain-containing protein [Micromonospora deserti]|uniref:saccharopine dehydrogenase C-terminal domain-containing protein n=1 Tax=Micromonospora deserti TaxID=2070366 RepID=UPI001F30910B
MRVLLVAATVDAASADALADLCREHRITHVLKAVDPHHVVDNEWSMSEYSHQAVAWQTAVNAVVALELLATGAWSGTGVLGPEALPPQPYLDLLNGYGSPWGMEER